MSQWKDMIEQSYGSQVSYPSTAVIRNRELANLQKKVWLMLPDGRQKREQTRTLKQKLKAHIGSCTQTGSREHAGNGTRLSGCHTSFREVNHWLITALMEPAV